MPLSTAAFPCCRDHDLFALVEEYPQRIQRTPGDEAYWFGWDSSFDGKATIRIAKLRDDVMVSRIYPASRFWQRSAVPRVTPIDARPDLRYPRAPNIHIRIKTIILPGLAAVRRVIVVSDLIVKTRSFGWKTE